MRIELSLITRYLAKAVRDTNKVSISEKFFAELFYKKATNERRKNNKQNIKQHEQLWKTKNFKN